ncbi:hypothetical protein N7468_009361 [Penicillium chermesinum]|uniref:Uncharacterized protein n=1 Tax=Penicillium chermesinum TaxID=63820 RepID=A0A9W9TES2_9EURO|nr:uncharacterized protein N7468_009361 [Penicillium chermesinum]KAJ5220157.1 hypothetical protein N7468_009361 [Penicillium chermesinum]KAJ6157606.1 hypothetical protein N7470_005198 [Penicillium chermesinum]
MDRPRTARACFVILWFGFLYVRVAYGFIELFRPILKSVTLSLLKWILVFFKFFLKLFLGGVALLIVCLMIRRIAAARMNKSRESGLAARGTPPAQYNKTNLETKKKPWGKWVRGTNSFDKDDYILTKIV